MYFTFVDILLCVTNKFDLIDLIDLMLMMLFSADSSSSSCLQPHSESPQRDRSRSVIEYVSQ